MGLVRPSAAAAFTSIRPEGLMGVSEIRATYGGLFAALGAWGLWTQEPNAFTTAGVAWLGAALGRAASVVVDRNRDPRNLGGIAFEGAIGLALLAGS
jgi:hypothetical protein